MSGPVRKVSPAAMEHALKGMESSRAAFAGVNAWTIAHDARILIERNKVLESENERLRQVLRGMIRVAGKAIEE